MTECKPSEILIAAGSDGGAIPVRAVAGKDDPALDSLSEGHKAWVAANGFRGQAKRMLLLPGQTGRVEAVLFGLGEAKTGDPGGPVSMLAGTLATALPAGIYRFDGGLVDDELATLAFGLGSYSFQRYKPRKETKEVARLEVGRSVDLARVLAICEGVWLARDLINTPAEDMGPGDLEAAARALGERHGAEVSSIVGEDLLRQNFPLIHAVGRASPREPRLVDLVWGDEDGVKITLVGKGICFDTGGLDLKPSSGMLNMKKDMGGAATVLGLASMIMSLGLKVRLRAILAIAENSVSGNAFRPRDIFTARTGATVEIGNTDAEGRLVLADALALGDEEEPDLLVSFATLTGAARVAMGPDLAPFFCDDDGFSARIAAAGGRVGDPLWRLPFWDGYDSALDSDIADINNISELGSAGAIIAALFLRRFVKKTSRYAHFDIFGWMPKAKPIGPKGGEAQGARAMLEVISEVAAGNRS